MAAELDTSALSLEIQGSPIGSVQSFARVQSQGDGSELLIVALDGLRIEAGGSLRVTGARPLVIVSTDEVRVDGTIDVGAQGREPGAGAGSTECAADLDGQTRSAGVLRAGSGGGGGGHGTPGGAGARIDLDDVSIPGGLDNGTDLLSPLRGGCPGGRGGHDQLAAGGGAGGGGGGAIQIISATSIRIDTDGTISAAGGGGGGASTVSAGGAGGGSGGAILLEAVEIEQSGVLAVNGGGGGEGSRGGPPGGQGADGALRSDDPADGGVDGSGGGGDGGKGATRTAQAEGGKVGRHSTIAAGSGGGGGGIGRTQVIDH